MPFTSIQARLGPARPPFLLLTLSCVFLGVALSWHAVPHDATWWLHVGLVLLGGLAAHVSVNALNEYMDFKVGLDQTTQRTPFSGGSGVLPSRPDLAAYTLMLGVGTLLMTVWVGFYFLWAVPGARLPLLMLGGLGVVLVAIYTPWLTRRPWLCLVAPGLGFGPAMVLGTQVVLTGAMELGGCARIAGAIFHGQQFVAAQSVSRRGARSASRQADAAHGARAPWERTGHRRPMGLGLSRGGAGCVVGCLASASCVGVGMGAACRLGLATVEVICAQPTRRGAALHGHQCGVVAAVSRCAGSGVDDSLNVGKKWPFSGPLAF